MDAEPRPGWAVLVLLFAASLLTLSAWLVQFARNIWRGRKATPAPARLWAAVLRLGAARGGAASSPAAGARGLLSSLFAFRAFRENWQRAWLRALNHQARQQGSSVQITFEECPRQLPAVTVSHVACIDQSDCRMVLHCLLSTDTAQFPVSVTQQSPAAVSMDTYEVSLAVQQAQLEIHLEEVEGEGLLVAWAFKGRPDLKLSVSPRLQPHDENDGKVDLSVIRNLIEDSIISTQPAMMVNLKACIANANVEPSSRLPQGPLSSSVVPLMPKLLLQHLQALHLGPRENQGNGLLCCEVELDSPRQWKRTAPVPAGSASPSAEVEWPDKLVLELGPGSKELVLRVFECSLSAEDVLLGFAAVPIDTSKEPQGQQLYMLSPGAAKSLPPTAAIAVEMLHQELQELQAASSLRTSITPTKKIEMGRTIMPDGTIVTTVTTIQSRPKLDCKLDSPSRSPSKVEVTEVTTMLPGNGCPSRASPCSSRGSCVSNGLDPVAETAIRQLTDLTKKPVKKTPTKRSTLIISGVSKVPIAQDDMALSLGYATSLQKSLGKDSVMAGLSEYTPSVCDPTQQLDSSYSLQRASQDLDEATHSDISERASMEDVESETGSTGALETRSLKDHKVGFLRSGTKLIFRKRNKQKEAGLSQSQDDLPNAGTASAPRKKAGSFSRRLIKRFSFKRRAKNRANGSAVSVEKH